MILFKKHQEIKIKEPIVRTIYSGNDVTIRNISEGGKENYFETEFWVFDGFSNSFRKGGLVKYWNYKYPSLTNENLIDFLKLIPEFYWERVVKLWKEYKKLLEDIELSEKKQLNRIKVFVKKEMGE